MSGYSPQTPSQTMGPMYGYSLTWKGCERTVEAGDPEAVTIEGLLLDGAGEPVAYPDGMVEVWQGEQFARSRTDPYGRWQVTVRRPVAEPLPDGTPQAPHLNVTVFARGLMKQAMTRVYFPDEASNATDPVLALIEPERRELLLAEPGEDARTLRFDIHLQGERETVFFDF